ncbi:gem-associated protein 2 [Selaginella moellendorffii]|uniref:gem-associated protein 2 n=1 Tax=Selaginella moellendorffii TaxID=88036 RepID=UPI000D1CA5FA|nr:gem-associated protein 2 [Selaginella moellendorffii]|eukprot:XP_024526169.1 gem-associated protein 2 [Selaginella moellendorffii]
MDETARGGDDLLSGGGGGTVRDDPGDVAASESRQVNGFLASAKAALSPACASRPVVRYRRGELLKLRFSDERSCEKWLQICEALGDVALELDSIFTHNDQEHFDWRYSHTLQSAEKSEDDVNLEEVEYYSDSSEGEGLRKPALYVEGEPDFDSGPPQDGFEFLRRVRWEEARCERVKVAAVSASKLCCEQTAYMPDIPPIAHCDPELLPLRSWEAEFVSDFSKLRLKLLSDIPSGEACCQKKLPHFRDRDAWRVYCFGTESRSSDNDNGETSDYEQEHTGQLPSLSTLLSMDEVSRATLLRHHISWLDDLENLAEERALWLYALSAVVDEPLDLDTSAAVRELLRKCALIRASRNFRGERELEMLNIIITIAGNYFGQADR